MSFWDRYGKSISAGLILVVTALQAGLSDSHLTQAEILQVCVAATTALGIYLVPNVPAYPWAKTAIAAVGASLEVAVTLVENGVSSADWTAIVLAALTVLTVGAAPAAMHRPIAAPVRTGTGALPTTRNTGVFDGPRADGPREL